ncbi:MAG TPA: PD-(D/E)XK nuclease family protein [Mycobacteriales bacterium]|nr:PD-(D/E)XK nuclease family protein [Mycobacteriales bacterium]
MTTATSDPATGAPDGGPVNAPEGGPVGAPDGGQVDLPAPVLGSLSPSRAADFKTCPLLYRFRSIDRIPQLPTRDKVRGTVVHAVLDRLFDLPAPERTFPAAAGLVEPEWQRLAEAEPAAAELFADDPDGAALAGWLESAREMVAGYFALEDPRRLEPAAREQLVQTLLDGGLLLRGYVDRLDVAPTGEVRVVDYKTGGIPREAFETHALFQLKFYALVLWRTRGEVPRQLRLMYLGDRDTLTYAPDAEELARFERTLLAIWRAIERARETGDFRASPSRLCGWCDHKPLCPAHGGTPPPYPEPGSPAAGPADPAPSARPAEVPVEGPATAEARLIVAPPEG